MSLQFLSMLTPAHSTAAELRKLPKSKLFDLLKEAEAADQALAHEPADTPARKANAFLRRRLLYLCGLGFQFNPSPPYYYTEERVQIEEQRLLAKERGQEAEWEEEQNRKRWEELGFGPCASDDMSDEEIEEDFAQAAGLVAALCEPFETSDGDQAFKPRKVKKAKQSKKAAKPTKRARSKVPVKLELITAQPRFFAVPGPDCLSPRDGSTVERTDDYLFIALLIERSRTTGWIKAEYQPGDTPDYLPVPPPEIIQGKGLPRYYATKTLRRLLTHKRDLWILRRYIQNEKAPSVSISIGEHTLCRDGKWQRNALRKQFNALRHPIEIGKPDSLLAGLHAQSFFSWCDLTQPQPCTLSSKAPEPLNLPPDTAENGQETYIHLQRRQRDHSNHTHHQLLCPLDGPITPIEVRISSPAWTWMHLCGRRYHSLHCPHCLARLHSKLGVMN